MPSQPRLYRPDLHYQGEWPGIHYVAFTKIPMVCSRPLGAAEPPHMHLSSSQRPQTAMHVHRIT
jgi:hypothetical protein